MSANNQNNEIEKVKQDLKAEMASRDSEIKALSVSKTSTKVELEKTSQNWLNFSTTSNSLFRGSSTASSRSPTLFGGFTGSSTTAASPIELVKELVMKSQPFFFTNLAYIPHIRQHRSIS